MDELISRQAVIDGLNRLDVSDGVGISSIACQFQESAISAIQHLPSVQPEIVRCKDCKHREAENGFCKGRGWPMQLVPDDGFCDNGERRTDE